MILILLLYALCALTFTIGKATLAHTQPIFYVGIRMILAGIALAGFYKIWTGKKISVKRGDWPLFAQIMLFTVYCAYVFDLWSLKFITSIESALIFNLSPFMAAIFSYIWFKECMTAKKIAGLMIGAGSILPLLFTRDLGYVLFDASRAWPICVLIAGVASSAYGWIVMRELVKVRDYSPLMVNGIGMFGGGIAALITSYFMEPWAPTPVTNWPQFIKLLLLMIVIANILFSNFYSYLLKHYTATLLSFAGFTCPLFASGFSWYFLGEPLSWKFFFSFLTVTVGLYLFYQEELKLGYVE